MEIDPTPRAHGERFPEDYYRVMMQVAQDHKDKLVITKIADAGEEYEHANPESSAIRGVVPEGEVYVLIETLFGQNLSPFWQEVDKKAEEWGIKNPKDEE